MKYVLVVAGFLLVGLTLVLLESRAPTAGDNAPAVVTPQTLDAAHASEWDARLMPDPCRLVTPADVSRALGRPVTTSSRLNTWPPLCRLPLDDQGLSLFVADDSRPEGLVAFEQARSDPGGVQAVPALATEALWSGRLRTLHVRSGSHYLKVLFSGRGGPTGDDARAAAIAVARLALDALPPAVS